MGAFLSTWRGMGHYSGGLIQGRMWATDGIFRPRGALVRRELCARDNLRNGRVPGKEAICWRRVLLNSL